MVPAVAEEAADVGGGHLRTYYYLHDSRYRCDNNCQVYGKTQKYFDSKHISVLRESVLQNTLLS